MSKKILTILFFSILFNIKSDIFDETESLKLIKPKQVFFYTLASKILLPNIVVTKKYRYSELYVGSSLGIDFYFKKSNKFKFGLFSFRHETLQSLLNIILDSIDYNWDNVPKSFIFNLLNSLCISLLNFKFGPISINFLTIYPFLRIFISQLTDNKYISNYKNLMKNETIYQNQINALNVQYYSLLFLPNIKIDISQIIYNIRHKKSFFNTL